MYAAAVERSGGEPVEVPLDQPPAETARLIAGCQGVLLPGSGADVNPQKYGQEPVEECNPADAARENVDELLLQDAHNMGKPILTICFGTQMLNVWRGGSLVQHLPGLPVNHRAGRAVAVAHTAAVAPGSLLDEVVGEAADAEEAPVRDGLLRLPVNSSHHQAIEAPGDGLRVSARSSEDGVIEAVEGTRPSDPTMRGRAADLCWACSGTRNAASRRVRRRGRCSRGWCARRRSGCRGRLRLPWLEGSYSCELKTVAS